LGFHTRLTSDANAYIDVETPPPDLFRLVSYPSAVGDLAAYVTADPHDGVKHPAIVWIWGGDTNTIGDVWSPEPPENDQSASPYREAGVVMMFPSLRGGNMNPGAKEGFLGETDDILAAADYLAAQPYVDPERIYLGGHSTGGTLVLLVAELSNRFRAVFSFGAVANPAGYGEPTFTPFDTSDEMEVLLRSPGAWLDAVQTPTWVMEGTESPSNIRQLRLMDDHTSNPALHFVEIDGYDHFSDLDPTNRILAGDIMSDQGTGPFVASVT